MNAAFILSTPLSRAFLTPTSPHLHRHPLRPHPVRKRPRSPTPTLSANATNVDDPILEGPFKGAYGQWYLTKSEADGVTQYRAALSVMAASAISTALLALTNGHAIPSPAYDALYAIFTAAFGFSLQKIHIYARPLHKTLKALWTIAAAGAFGMLCSPQTSHSIVVAAYDNPLFLLAIGWQFVALTGLFIKEAFCFGNAEALALIALVPALSGGHFIHLLSVDVERYSLVILSVMFLIFAVRKFTQPAKEDIGDLSVFQHLAKGGQL